MRASILVAAAGLLVMVPWAGALQPASVPAPAAGTKTEPPKGKTAPVPRTHLPENAAARAITRTALLDLRLTSDPKPSDYRIANLIMNIAAGLTPDDTELARRIAEAAWNSGMQAEAIKATRRLVSLDTKDTVAQLRLISAIIAQEQTVAGRAAMYQKFLGAGGSRIDPSVRSRLALDAALLAREQGDEDSFRKLLKQAISLDLTNKEAAMLALMEFQQARPDDSVGRFEMLSNLLMSDPLDPAIHLTLASELARGGAFLQSARWHDVGIRLMLKTGATPPTETEVESLVLEWQIKGPKEVLEKVNRELVVKRDQVRRYNETYRKGIGLGEEFGNPEDVRMDFETEKVRMSLAIALKDDATLRASMTDMQKSVEFVFMIAGDDKKRPIGLSRDVAMAQGYSKLLDLQFWRALTGVDVEKVEEDLKKFEAAVGADQPGPTVVRALAAARLGDGDAAIAQLNAALDSVDKDSMLESAIAFGRGIAYAQLGQTDKMIEEYRRVERAIPMTPLGGMSRARVEQAIGKPEVLTAHAEQLEALSKLIPEWVDRAAKDPRSYMSMQVDAPSFGGPLAEALVTFHIRNVAPIPLGMGSNRPINSRFLLAPLLAVRAPALARQVRTEVVDLDRRLRIEPGEIIHFSIEPEWGFTGLLADLAISEQTQLTWRALQGFMASRDGIMYESATSLTSETHPIVRPPLEESRTSVATVADSITSATGTDFVKAVAVARRILWTESLVALNTSGLDQLRNAPVQTKPPDAKPADGSLAPPTPVQPSSPAAATPPDPKLNTPVTLLPAELSKPAAATPPSTPAAKPATPPTSTQPGGKPADPAGSVTAAEKQQLAWATDRVSIAKALTERFARSDVPAKLLMIASLPHAGQFAEMTDFDKAALSESDPRVRALALLTRARTADEPALAEAAASPDANLVELAGLITERLKGASRTYAKLGPGLAAIAGNAPVAR